MSQTSSWSLLSSPQAQGQILQHPSPGSLTLHRSCRIPLICESNILLCGALRPAPHHPCLAWRQAVLSQFSALETSGISLSVSQNSPKAPLISYSCCVAASRRLHPEHPPRWWQECRWHSPRSSGIPHPWGSPYTCRGQGSFFNPKTNNSNPKGTATRRQPSLCTDTADVSELQHQPCSLPRAGERQHYPSHLAHTPGAHTFSRIKQSRDFCAALLSMGKSPESRSQRQSDGSA